MKLRQLPIISTIVVLAAAATMVALGIWQLGRADEKAALIARYQAAMANSAAVEYPADPDQRDAELFRRTSVTCASVGGWDVVAGTGSNGAKGWVHRATCALPEGQTVKVDVGFAQKPAPVEWGGGEVQGIVAPGGRIVSDQGLAGLEPLARPDPRDLPNNHLAYAGQWFFFALTALVIYGLAIRKRLQGRD